MRITTSISACLLLAACGEVHSFTDAGSSPDDAEALDATAVGTVNVTALAKCCTNARQPVADVEIVSIDADGSPRDRVQTDAAGEATVDVLAGGSVTAVYPLDASSGQRYLATFGAVDPGDELTFGDDFWEGTGATMSSMRVTWPSGVPNISYWYVYYDCGYSYATGTAAETLVYRYDYAHCRGATTDLVLIGYDTSLGQYARHASLQDVTWVADGVVSFATTTLGTNTVNFSVTGLPPEINSVYTSAWPVTGPYSLPDAWASGTPSGGTFNQTGQMIPEGDSTGAYLELRRTGDFGYQYSRRRLPASPSSVTWASPTILPWIGQVASSAAARTITWIQLGDQPYDATTISLYWYTGVGGKLFGGVGVNYNWNLILPPGIDEVRFPTLTGDLAEVMPPDDYFLYPDIALVESELFDGYDEVKTHPEWEARCPDCVAPGATTAPATTYSRALSGD
jgi:hypothetical protein